jgi:hypothetical protein
MSGIWFYALALAGLTAMTIAVACWFAIRFVAPVLLAQTRQGWRLARPVWTAFAAGITLTVAGGGLLSILIVLLFLTPSSGRLPDAAGPVFVFAFVAGSVCTALGMLGFLLWIGLGLVGILSIRRVVHVDHRRRTVAFVFAGLTGISGGVEVGAAVHAWPLSLVLGMAIVGVAFLMTVIMVRILEHDAATSMGEK